MRVCLNCLVYRQEIYIFGGNVCFCKKTKKKTKVDIFLEDLKMEFHSDMINPLGKCEINLQEIGDFDEKVALCLSV